jgi:hypothetical protein
MIEDSISYKMEQSAIKFTEAIALMEGAVKQLKESHDRLLDSARVIIEAGPDAQLSSVIRLSNAVKRAEEILS